MPQIKFNQIQPSDLTEAQLKVVGAEQGRLLRFEGAVLARAEVNKNFDEIDADGISQVAATLPLLAIDDEHKERVIVGYFTDARAVNGALETDGIIFADRFPEIANEIVSGKALLSIEADARHATCSVCGNTFVSEAQYCEHLANRLSGKAVRKLSGMSAVGGGVTRNPAGTNTKFDQNRIVFMASRATDASREQTRPSEQLAPSEQPPPSAKIAPDVDARKQANAALAAQRLFAAFTSDLSAPPSLGLFRPVLSPLTYVENPPWLDELVARVTERVSTQVVEAMRATLKPANVPATTATPEIPAAPAEASPKAEASREQVKQILADKLGANDTVIASNQAPVSVGLMGVALDAQTTPPTTFKASW